MNLHVIHAGGFKLDGGAMFGVVPKSLWNRTNPADENNMCSWAMRCLLVVDGDRVVLIDNGMGNKQSEKFFSFYYLHGDQTLHGSLQQAGFAPSEVTDMFMTHLHFDHCGGGVSGNSEDGYEAVFNNARYWSNEAHWQWASEPNPRERASFLKENFEPIEASGQLGHVEAGKSPFDWMDIILVDGHTDKMMLPKIKYKDKTIVFVADLLPSTGHIPLAWVMGYDTRPLLTMKEKDEFLNEAADNNYVLFFEHDPQHECCTVKRTEKGVRMDQAFPLSDIL